MKAHPESRDPSFVACSNTAAKGGFTLVELLVVIAIMMVLASMLLPALSRSKRQVHMTTCLNNLRQLTYGTKFYADDNQNRFPRKFIPRVDLANTNVLLGDDWNAQYSIGGPDARPEWMDEEWEAPPASYRPLNRYVPPSQVYRCPEDKGMRNYDLSPANWESVGCSYQYNAGMLRYLSGEEPPSPFADWFLELANKPESWVTEPVKHILFYEPPARLYPSLGTLFNPSISPPRWYQWHQSLPKTEFADPRLARSRFVSPIAFVDGHVARHDFTTVIIEHLRFPYVPTEDWIWYKPAPQPIE